MFELKDKVAIVTGATSGIGKAAAIAYAKQGAKVVVSGRRETEGGRVVSEIKASGGDALFVKADVSIESDVEELFLKTIAHYGKVDSVFLNSGVFKFGSLAEQTGENLQDQLNVNVLGAYYGVKSGAQHLSRGGTIILNSSVVGSIGMPNASAYSLTKGRGQHPRQVGRDRACLPGNSRERGGSRPGLDGGSGGDDGKQRGFRSRNAAYGPAWSYRRCKRSRGGRGVSGQRRSRLRNGTNPRGRRRNQRQVVVRYGSQRTDWYVGLDPLHDACRDAAWLAFRLRWLNRGSLARFENDLNATVFFVLKDVVHPGSFV